MKFNSNKCKSVLTRIFFTRDLSYEMGAFHLEKIERGKGTGVLVDNRVEFKPLVQWGQKKVKSDLKTS